MGKVSIGKSLELGLGYSRINTVTTKTSIGSGFGLGTPIQISGGISQEKNIGRLDHIISAMSNFFSLKNPYRF